MNTVGEGFPDRVVNHDPDDSEERWDARDTKVGKTRSSKEGENWVLKLLRN